MAGIRDELIRIIAGARPGHDSLGPTGLVAYITPEQRDAFVADLSVPQGVDVNNLVTEFQKVVEAHQQYFKRAYVDDGDVIGLMRYEKVLNDFQVILDALAHQPKTNEGSALLRIEPKADACEHDFQGWHDFPDGSGGEQVCTKCGMGAMHHTLMTEE